MVEAGFNFKVPTNLSLWKEWPPLITGCLNDALEANTGH